MYIEDLIIVKYKNQRTKKFAVFENTENVVEKIQNFGKILQNIGNFSFCEPKIQIVEKKKPADMFKKPYDISDEKKGSSKSAVTIHDELQHKDMTFYFKHDPETNILTLSNACKPDWNCSFPPWWKFVHNKDTSCPPPVFLQLYSCCETRFGKLKAALDKLSSVIKEKLKSEIKTLSDEVTDDNYLDDDIQHIQPCLESCKTEKDSASFKKNVIELNEHCKKLHEKITQRSNKLFFKETITKVLDSFSDDERAVFDYDWDKIYTKIKEEFDRDREVVD